MITQVNLPVLVLGFISWIAIHINGRVVSWVSLSPSEALLRGLEPVGLEGGGRTHTFLCRANIRNGKVSGRLVIDNGAAFCKTGFGPELNNKEFEILDVPIGATSWVPITREIPSRAIIIDSGRIAICRAMIDGRLIVGAYNNNGEPHWGCWIGVDGREERRKDDLEVLVLNNYGVASGLSLYR